jgi:hypothetical protein
VRTTLENALERLGCGILLEGFYKVRFHVNDAVGRSVMYAHGGSMLCGNSAFAHYGSYREADGVVTSEITSQRHNDDPNYQSHPIFGGYQVGIGFAGSCDANAALLEATALAGKRSLRLTAVLKLMCPA